jgi:hypothetical protein
VQDALFRSVRSGGWEDVVDLLPREEGT